MSIRTLHLQMKRGMAIVKQCTEIPLKDDVLLHVNEYTFFCSPTTMDKLARYKALEDPGEANKKLEQFFLHETIASPNLTQFCFDFDKVIQELKTDMVIGNQGNGSYAEHWEVERDENVLKMMGSNTLERKAAGLDKLHIYTDPNGFYKAMVDHQRETVEFIQFEEALSVINQRNVMAEHVNINRRPMYVIDKLLSLVMYVRDVTKNREWGQ